MSRLQFPSEEEAPPSKTMILLKRQINEISSGKDLSQNTSSRQGVKLAAPKPVRPKPHGLSHHLNPKWIQSSPVKSDPSFRQISQLSAQCSEDSSL
jgi:hypothetical protein